MQFASLGTERSNLGFENRISTNPFLCFLLRKSKQMDPKKLGKKIKLARIELDLTQTQLAEKINGKQKSISGYETGATLPSIRTLIKIAKVLKKPTSHFLDE